MHNRRMGKTSTRGGRHGFKSGMRGRKDRHTGMGKMRRKGGRY